MKKKMKTPTFIYNALLAKKNKSDHMVFSVATWDSSWTDGLVFTVMAENEICAEELVRHWLESNGMENHKIDRIRALVSRDVSAIVNVGAKLLNC